jgi:peptide/nickel transport system permease protein
MTLRTYILTRIALTLPMLLFLLSLVFVIMRILPGNPVLLRFEKNADPALIAEYTHRLGLDLPMWQQYANYLVGLLHGNLGQSMVTFDPVANQILSRFPATLELTLGAFLVAAAVGLIFGSTAARRAGGKTDGTVKVYGILIYAFPIFFLGMILQLVFGIWLRWLPIAGRIPSGLIPAGLNWGSIHIQTGLYTVDSLLAGNFGEFFQALKYLLLPCLTLGLVISGVFVRMTRSNMLETMKMEFVTAARARGLKDDTVVYGYALRNALLPIVTIMGLQFALLLGGAILTETEFNILGIGQYLVDRITFRDYTAVQGTVVFLAILISMVSLLVDVIYAYLDPRIRL